MNYEDQGTALAKKMVANEGEAQKQPAFDKMKFLETAKAVSPSIWNWNEKSFLSTFFSVIAESLSRSLTEDRQ